jgi:peroxiredoxin
MRTWYYVLAVMFAAGATAAPAFAGLAVGTTAPQFKAEGALAGKPFAFSLASQLKKGPVVLYFFPAAFTAGCTIEAHEFAEATEAFNKLGATVVGVTAGNVDRVADFSSLECRDKFAVLADPGAKIATNYHSDFRHGDVQMSNRTSYVIAQNGQIVLSYEDLNPEQHVKKTLAAVQSLARN